MTMNAAYALAEMVDNSLTATRQNKGERFIEIRLVCSTLVSVTLPVLASLSFYTCALVLYVSFARGPAWSQIAKDVFIVRSMR